MHFKISYQVSSANGPSLPFVKFNEANRQFDFEPNKMSQVGSYDIEVILDDYFAPKYVYRFRLNVEDPS